MSGLLSRTTDILSTPLGDSLLMMNIKRGHYHGLNSVGARIWELLETPTTEANLVATLVTEFEVTEKQCAAEVGQFLQDLRGRGLLMDAD